MIIYFDYNLSNVKLLQQQNEQKYFVVDFLNEYFKERDFEKIITNICGKSEEILEILKKEKNTVILPNELVAVNNIEVPNIKRKTKEHFETKFDLIYNKDKDLKKTEFLYSTNKNIATFVFATTKEKFIKQITSTFEMFGVKINNFSFFSAMVRDYVLQAQKSFAKENFVVALVGDNIDLVAVSKGEVVCQYTIYNNIEKQSRKYVAYIKSNYKKISKEETTLEDLFKKSEKKEKKVDFYERFQFFVDNFSKYLKNSGLNFEFEKIVFIDNTEKKLADFDFKGEIFDLEKVDVVELMKTATSNYFVEQKKGFFSFSIR